MSDHRKRTFELMNRVHQKDLVYEFFFVFSRFEYALLGTGYIYERNGGVFADWDKFAREHDQAFTDLTEGAEGRSILRRVSTEEASNRVRKANGKGNIAYGKRAVGQATDTR